VGKQGGDQAIRCDLASGSFSAGSIAHEIGHALGFYHEHQRPERDAIVAVAQSAITNQPSDFNRIDDQLPVGLYDCQSIMHYPKIFAKITNIDPACAGMGNRANLSPGDIDTINFMYGRFPLSAPIAALARSPDFMDIFSVADGGGMQGACWNGNPWRPWFRLFAKSFSALTPIAAVSRNDNQMDLFATEGGQLWSCWFTGGWNDWFSLPLPLGAKFPPLASVAALARSPDFMDVFAVDDTGDVRGVWWNGNPWRPWFTLGGKKFPPGAPLGAVTRNPNHMELFGFTEERLWANVFDGQWNGWFNPLPQSDQHFRSGTPIKAISRNPDQMDLFAIAKDGQLRSCFWAGSWHDWFALDLPRGELFPPGAPVAALSRSPDFMDVFAVDAAGDVRGVWWNGNPWRPWFTLGGKKFPPGAPIGAISRNSNQMDIFVVADDQGIWSNWFDGTWHDWFRVT
jgi:hypothetical protein